MPYRKEASRTGDSAESSQDTKDSVDKMLDIPGLGKKVIEQDGYDKKITLTIEEIVQVTMWPDENIKVQLKNFSDLPVFIHGDWSAAQDRLVTRWIELTRLFAGNFKDRPIASSLDIPVTQLPEAVIWGKHPVTGQDLGSYPAITCDRLRFGEQWKVRWFDSPEAAQEATEKHRQEIRDLTDAYTLREEALRDLPVWPELPPKKYEQLPPPSSEEILKLAGDIPRRYKVNVDKDQFEYTFWVDDDRWGNPIWSNPKYENTVVHEDGTIEIGRAGWSPSGLFQSPRSCSEHSLSNFKKMALRTFLWVQT